MVNFNQEKSTIKSELTTPNIEIDITEEQSKKMIAGYNILIKRELLNVCNILFTTNSLILNMDPSNEKFNDTKLEISKLLVNVISALNGLEVVYVNDKSADNDKGTSSESGTGKKG